MSETLGFTTDKASAILAANITEDVYVCLSTTTPTKNGGNFSEPPASNGYARKKFGKVNKTIAAQVANEEYIFVFEALADCGSATHAGLSQGLNGVPFLVGKLLNPITIGAGYVPLIRPRKFVIGLDKEALEAYA